MTRPLRRVLLAIACLALSGTLLAACGGDDKEAKQLLRQTFDSSATALETGRLNLRFQLDPEGLLKLGGPVKLAFSGPFAAPRGGDLPRFDVDFVATLANRRFRGGVLSTGKKAFVRLDDRVWAIDAPVVARLREGAASASARKPQATLKALGIDPPRWIINAEEKGEERVGGVETLRIGGDINVARLLEDVDTLLTKVGGSQGAGAGAVLTPALRKQIAGAVKSTKADVWTGAEDKLLRQLAVRVRFAFKRGQTPIQGLDGGVINLRLRLDDVNKTAVDLTAPRAVGPLSRLTGGSIANVWRGIGAGLKAEGGTGFAGGALLACITNAEASSVDLVRCLSKLAP